MATHLTIRDTTLRIIRGTTDHPTGITMDTAIDTTDTGITDVISIATSIETGATGIDIVVES